MTVVRVKLAYEHDEMSTAIGSLAVQLGKSSLPIGLCKGGFEKLWV